MRMIDDQKWLDDATPSNFRENMMLEKTLPFYHQLQERIKQLEQQVLEKAKRIEELETEIEQVKNGVWKHKKPDCPPHKPKICHYFDNDAPVFGCSQDKYGQQCWYNYFKKLDKIGGGNGG